MSSGFGHIIITMKLAVKEVPKNQINLDHPSRKYQTQILAFLFPQNNYTFYAVNARKHSQKINFLA